MHDICINIVFEDMLSGAVLGRLLTDSRRKYTVALRYNTSGFGPIKSKVNGFNHAAKGMPYLILTDLDRHECPPVLIEEWLGVQKHPNLLFRIAVKEVEAWLLACKQPFASFLGVPESRIPANVEGIADPKEFVVSLARRSRKKSMRIDVAPEPGSTAKVGPDYNGRLVRFVETSWDPGAAQENSPSLRRAMEALDAFEPVY